MTQNVYFAVAPGRIKIGVSIDVAERLKEVGAHLPEMPQLLGVVRGDELFERAIHKVLKPYRLKGEWFKDCPEVRDTIARILKEGPSAIGHEPVARRNTNAPRVHVDPWTARGASLDILISQCERASEILRKHERRKMLRALRLAVDGFGALIESALRDVEADDVYLLREADKILASVTDEVRQISRRGIS